MSIWKRLFKSTQRPKPSGASTNEEKQAQLAQLEEWIKPLIRRTTRIDIQKPSRPPQDSRHLSHVGGHPYFEQGREWPETKKGEPLQFIFQIWNEDGLELPKSVKLIQFFYDWEEFPWDTDNDGWLVRIYREINPEKEIEQAVPAGKEAPHYCALKFETVQTLPDWEGIDVFGPKASDLSCQINDDEPWQAYQDTVEKLIGDTDYQSQLGGYPNWVQGESTPKDSEGKPMKLLFQIDSDDNAGFMWGDVGLIYAFYDEQNERVEFCLQCH
ncbi:DUF1963 domain-containing protein [bacterium SCSIO 12741]|nr:DUF1963 domain-containing protein [bacterium SCSIO 12741]